MGKQIRLNKKNKNNGERDLCVYRYIDEITGEIMYVGKTNSSLRARIVAHRYEEKFLEHGPYKVEFVELSNKVETDSVEKILINLWKPLLNDKDKVIGLTDNIELDNLNWIPYSEYKGVDASDRQLKNQILEAKNKTKFLKQCIECIRGENFENKFYSNQLYSCNSFALRRVNEANHEEYIEYITLTKPNICNENGRYLYEVQESKIEYLEEYGNQLALEIWLPILRMIKMNEEQELEYSLLLEEIELGETIDDFARNGFEDEYSLEKYSMRFDRIFLNAVDVYRDILGSEIHLGKSNCYVDIDKFGYKDYMNKCKEDTGNRIMCFVQKLDLIEEGFPEYHQKTWEIFDDFESFNSF